MQRLKTRSQFQAVLAGATLARTAHFALHRADLDITIVKSTVTDSVASSPMKLFPTQDVWVGALVPKRWAKCAVTRNAIKRQIYSVSADCESVFAPAAHIVRLRQAFDRKQFTSATSDLLKAAIRVELQQLFARAKAFRSSSAVLTGSP